MYSYPYDYEVSWGCMDGGANFANEGHHTRTPAMYR